MPPPNTFEFDQEIREDQMKYNNICPLLKAVAGIKVHLSMFLYSISLKFTASKQMTTNIDHSKSIAKANAPSFENERLLAVDGQRILLFYSCCCYAALD